MHEIVLTGCTPEPLASYLKALGVLRVVAEQFDGNVRAHWSGNDFVLTGTFTRESLIDFLLEGYRPTPIVTPWNGGSGFFPKDARDAISAIEQSTDPRFEAYRNAIATARVTLSQLGIAEKPDKQTKLDLLEHLRAGLADDALDWLDAVALITEDGAQYPPLLGTGGNDGRLEFGNNHMQRLVQLLLEGERVSSQDLLQGSLFGTPIRGLNAAGTTGQFFPGRAGGANAGAGFEGRTLINAWDYVFMMEGALLFAAAATRRLESAGPGALSFPFTVRATPAGYGSATMVEGDTPRSSELWLPLWRASAPLNEIRALFAEGRARLESRTVGTGSDFARAIARLGVDRGIEEFTRHGFLVRNGLSYFAVPLERWPVRRRPGAGLIDPIDPWLNSLRRAARGRAPASIQRAVSAIENAILDLCRDDGPRAFQSLLVALSEADAALGRSRRFAESSNLRPLPLLDEAWLSRADDDSAEFALAASIASLGLRDRIAPVGGSRSRPDWDHTRAIDWDAHDIISGLIAVHMRELIDRERSREAEKQDERSRSNAWRSAPLGLVARFIERTLDDQRVHLLVRALSLCWIPARPVHPAAALPGLPPALYGLLGFAVRPSALHASQLFADTFDDQRARSPRNAATVLRRAAAGDAGTASRTAVRTLRGLRLAPLIEQLDEPPEVTRRCAAALIVPLSLRDARRVARQVLGVARQPLTATETAP